MSCRITCPSWPTSECAIAEDARDARAASLVQSLRRSNAPEPPHSRMVRLVGGAFWTVPNALSMARVPLAIAAVACEAAGARTIAMSLLCLSFVTDAVDGFVARVTHTESEWGRVLDPLADKLTFLIVAAALAVTGRVPGWLLVAMLLRELVLVGGSVVLTHRVARVPASNIPGKLASFVLALYLLRQMFWPGARALAWGLDGLGWLALALHATLA